MATTQEELLKAISDSQQKETAIVKAEQVRLEEESKRLHAELVTTKNATKESVDKVNTELNEMTKKYAQLEEEKRKSEERVTNLEMTVGKIGSKGLEEEKLLKNEELMALAINKVSPRKNYSELKEKYLRTNVFVDGQPLMAIGNPVIERELFNIAPIINYASVTTSNLKTLPVFVLINNKDFLTPGELSAIDDDNTHLIGSEEIIQAYRTQISVPVSLELLDLQTIPGINIEADLMSDAARALARKTGKLLTNGTGKKMALGIMQDEAVKTSTIINTVAKFDFDNIAMMMDELIAEYRVGASFMMNSKSLTNLRVQKNGMGSPLFETDYKASTPITLYGKPIIINDEMDNVETGTKSPIIFGDFKRFKVLKYSTVLADVNKSTVNLGFYSFSFRTYLGSKVTDRNAFVKAVIA